MLGASFFEVELSPVSFTRFSQRLRPNYLLKFTMQCFDSKIALDLLDESRAANRNCFRPP
jgi:hypothetical protein